jgi:hypothetical protein
MPSYVRKPMLAAYASRKTYNADIHGLKPWFFALLLGPLGAISLAGRFGLRIFQDKP